MIDIFSITYPMGVKQYLMRVDYVPEIMTHLYYNPNSITAQTLSNVLSIPEKTTLQILTRLARYGIVQKQTCKQRYSSVFSYALDTMYHIKLGKTEQKTAAAEPLGGLTA